MTGSAAAVARVVVVVVCLFHKLFDRQCNSLSQRNFARDPRKEVSGQDTEKEKTRRKRDRQQTERDRQAARGCDKEEGRKTEEREKRALSRMRIHSAVWKPGVLEKERDR